MNTKPTELKPTLTKALGISVTEARKLPYADSKLAYRVPEACQALGIGRTSLYELAKNGELRFIKIAGRTLVPRSEIERLTRLP